MKLVSILIFAINLLASWGSKGVTPLNEVPTKPNILFILVDDLGYMDLGFTGSSYYETPNIDALAKKGMVFTQGYATSRVCSPSRASILTGKFTARHGITNWIGESSGEDWRKMNRNDKMLPADYVHSLPSDEITLAEVLKENGYRTFYAGKWHLGGEGSLPTDHGFEVNKGGWDKGSPVGGYFSPFKNPFLHDEVDGENLSIRLANETLSFISENKSSPFFAFLSFYAVHGPIQTEQERWSKYREKAAAQGIKPNGYALERKLPIRQTQDNPIYAGLVESMDDAVGRVLDGLTEMGLHENTIVIFTSDNGGVASGDSFSTTNLPLRSGKGYQWEGGIREPFIVYVPWSNTEGEISNYPVTGADFFPTILEYAQIDPLKEQHKDGISLKPIISGSESLPQRPLFWHYPHYGNQGGDPASILREGNWKLIHYYEDGTNELYHLLNDPGEHNDVSSVFPKVTKNLGQKLEKWLVEVGAKYPTHDVMYDREKQVEYLTKIKNDLLPKLERERMDMLSEHFSPNADWWGSAVPKD